MDGAQALHLFGRLRFLDRRLIVGLNLWHDQERKVALTRFDTLK